MTDLEGAVERARMAVETWDRYQPSITPGEVIRQAVEMRDALRTILDALASITRERDAMREGMKPFAAIGHEAERSGFTQRDHEGAWGFNCINVTWGDFRRAAALVNGEGGE